MGQKGFVSRMDGCSALAAELGIIQNLSLTFRTVHADLPSNHRQKDIREWGKCQQTTLSASSPAIVISTVIIFFGGWYISKALLALIAKIIYRKKSYVQYLNNKNEEQKIVRDCIIKLKEHMSKIELSK
jgi:hypothetical protein